MKFKFFLLSLFISILSFAQQEKINAFHAEIAIDTSSLITVTETIAIEAYGDQFKRGIVRYLPIEKKDSLGKKVPLNYKILNVKKDGFIENYHTTNENGNLVIYVGNKDTFIPSGKHEYQITYTAENALSYYPDFDELYWNVNGFGWNFTIEDISANVTLPSGTTLLQTACYTGSYGSTATDCTGEIRDNQALFKGNRLFSEQNLTIAVGFEKGVIYEPPPPPLPSFLEQYGFLILGLIMGIGLLIYYFITWSLYGIDPKKPTVYPLFDVPDNLSPASIGMLHKERYWDDLITAALVNLAVKGFVQIEEIEKKAVLGIFKSKTFTIKKLKEPIEDLPIEEKTLIQKFFINTDIITIDGSYNRTIEKAVNQFKRAINTKHKVLINEGNNYQYLIIPSILILSALLMGGLYIYYFTADMLLPFLHILKFGLVSFIIFGCFIYSFLSLKKALFTILVIILLSAIIFLLIIPLETQSYNLFAWLGIMIFGITTLMIYQYLIKRPSEKKLKIQSEIEGFEMYLKTAEERQLQQFNPPKVTPEVFEKYLPYAIALDADKIWGQKFQQYLSKSSMDQDYQSTWYTGSHFNAMNFGHMLNSNLSNAISSSSTPPSTSSSSSGSSGGGFSGGGGGGGGGGGW